MKRTWIVLADKVRAKIFKQLHPNAPLELKHTLENPQGSLKNQELTTDRPGISQNTAPGASRNTLDTEVSGKEHVFEKFCKEVNEYLTQAHNEGRFDALILVAEPKALGVLRKSLSTTLSKMVVGSLNKDLVHLNERELPPYLEGLGQ